MLLEDYLFARLVMMKRGSLSKTYHGETGCRDQMIGKLTTRAAKM